MSKRRKTVTPEKKLIATLRKVDMAFEKLERSKLSVKSKKAEEDVKKIFEETGEVVSHKHIGKANEEKSYTRYLTQIRSFLKETGIIDLKDITPEVITAYVNKEIELFNTPIIEEQDDEMIEIYPKEHLDAPNRINNNLTALTALQLAIKETNALGVGERKEIDFGDIQDYRDIVTNSNCFRAKGNSSWAIPDNRTMRTLKGRLDKNAAESGKNTDQVITDFVRYCQITGARPTNGANQIKTNIHKNKDGSLVVTHAKDKGSRTRYVQIEDKEEIKFIEKLVAEAKGKKLFQAYKLNGKDMSTASFLKRLGEAISELSQDMKGEKKVKVKGNKQEFTIETKMVAHSPRKNFGTNQTIKYYEYFMKSPRETEKRILETIEKLHKLEVEAYERFKKENPPKTKQDFKQLDSLSPKIKKKYEGLVRKQNAKNKKYATKKEKANYKIVKTLSPEESAKFVSSALLGHTRTSVIVDSYLCPVRWAEVIAKYEKK
jgi:hypothetical protein